MTTLNRFEYPATRISKTNWKFSLVLFYAEAGDVHTWSGVYRKEISEKGYQRMLSEDHANHIKKFLASGANVIPNSVVLAFNDNLKIDNKVGQGAEFSANASFHPVNADGSTDLSTTVETGIARVHVHSRLLAREPGDDEVSLSEYRSAYVIDGQHRIIGGNNAGPNVYLPITAFLGVDREDQAFHFIVINRKARRVSKHDIDAVIPKKIYDGLQQRLVDAGIVSTDADIVYGLDNLIESPFRGLISWANNTADTAIIPKGAIDNIIRQVRKLDDDEVESLADNEIDLLIAMWHGVRRHLAPLWTEKLYKKNSVATYPNQLILKAAGVFPAIQRMIVAALEHGAISIRDDSADKAKALEDAVFDYVKTIPLEFFFCRWLHTSITNDARINELASLMTKAKRSKKVPYSDGKGWFAEPESIEAAEQKKAVERDERKKTRAAERAKKKKGSARKRRSKKTTTASATG